MSKNAAPSQSAVSPYTEVLILGPKIDNVEQYKKVYGPNVLIIGDGKRYITTQELHKALAGKIDQNTRIDIQCHGVTEDGKHYSQLFYPSTETSEVFKVIRDSNPTIPLHLHSWSCYSGAANQYAQSFLSHGSVLVTHSAEDESTSMTLGNDGILRSITKRKERRDRGENVLTARAEFVQNLDIAVDTTTYTETLGGTKKIEYVVFVDSILSSSKEASQYLLRREEEFNKLLVEQGDTRIASPTREAKDLAYLRNTSFVYKTCFNLDQLRTRTRESMEEVINAVALSRSALYTSVLHGKVDVIEELVNKGANVNIDSDLFSTPLHFATLIGQTASVKKLIERGAKIDEQDRFEQTPLHIAVDAKNIDIVKALIDAGADVNKVNGLDKTPLHLAVEAGNIDIVKALIDKGADVNIVDGFSQTPLHLAVEAGNIDIVTALIDAGADVNIVDGLDKTPLHLAVEAGNIDIVTALIDAGADLETRELEAGSTPLHIAAARGNVDIVRELINAGADISKVDKDGKTPLDFAQANGKTDVVQYLTRLETAKKIDQQHVLAMRELDQALGISSANHSTPTSSLERRNPVNRHNIQALARETRHLEQALFPDKDYSTTGIPLASGTKDLLRLSAERKKTTGSRSL